MKAVTYLVLCLLLAACSGGTMGDRLDEEKTTSALRRPNVLVAPPWEALVKAGPGAENEIDFETLNGPQTATPVPILPSEQPSDIQAQPVEEPQVATTEKQAEPPQPPATPAKPGETVIRAVAVPAIAGQKGIAHDELVAAMRAALKKAGWPVITAPRKDAITIQGHVQVSPPAGGNQQVAINWDVTTPDGKRLGDLKQNNDIPAGALDQGWGDNALYAADAAAEGIFKLIQKFR